MSQNTENIEAKLAAYVDGELDEPGRVEIEKHLVANPQHRQLLQELGVTRDLLRNLPRERAPVDLSDSLQGQLERSVLLGEPGDDPAGGGRADVVLRISRWPQLAAVAAIVLLAAGLGVVVYTVLAPSNQPLPTFTLADRPTALSVDGTSSDIAADLKLNGDASEAVVPPAIAMAPASGRSGSAAAEVRAARDLGGDTEAFASKSGPRDTAEVAGKMGIVTGATGAGSVAAIDPFNPQAIEAQLNNAGVVLQRENGGATARVAGISSNLFVVVRTEDPTITNMQVARFLTDNKISWEKLPAPAPTTVTHDELASTHAARFNQQQVQLKQIEPAMKPAAPEAATPSTQPAENNVLADVSQQKETAAEELVATKEEEPSPTTAPLQARVEEQQFEQREENHQQQAAPARQGQQLANADLIVARGMTRRQAAELSQQCVSEPNAKQNAVVVEQAAGQTLVYAAPASVEGPEAEPLRAVVQKSIEGNAPTSQNASMPATQPAGPDLAVVQKDDVPSGGDGGGGAGGLTATTMPPDASSHAKASSAYRSRRDATPPDDADTNAKQNTAAENTQSTTPAPALQPHTPDIAMRESEVDARSAGPSTQPATVPSSMLGDPIEQRLEPVQVFGVPAPSTQLMTDTSGAATQPTSGDEVVVVVDEDQPVDVVIVVQNVAAESVAAESQVTEPVSPNAVIEPTTQPAPPSAAPAAQ
ncbi:MAG: anti-sigma factor family protein [Tepidisphaeraceae bacterium]